MGTASALELALLLAAPADRPSADGALVVEKRATCGLEGAEEGGAGGAYGLPSTARRRASTRPPRKMAQKRFSNGASGSCQPNRIEVNLRSEKKEK